MKQKMQKLLSMAICIFLITGGSAETSARVAEASGPGKKEAAAVMLSASALDPLLKPAAANQLLPVEKTAGELKEEEKEGRKGKTNKEEGAGTEAAVPTSPPAPPAPRFSAKDIDLLARLVQAEAGGEPYPGKVAVAATVLNRVESPRYPNTIPGVIYQVSYGYQYCPVRNGTINRPAGDEARRAVLEALEGNDPTGGALSFYNPAKSWNAWIRSRPVLARIGSHLFVR